MIDRIQKAIARTIMGLMIFVMLGLSLIMVIGYGIEQVWLYLKGLGKRILALGMMGLVVLSEYTN